MERVGRLARFPAVASGGFATMHHATGYSHCDIKQKDYSIHSEPWAIFNNSSLLEGFRITGSPLLEIIVALSRCAGNRRHCNPTYENLQENCE